MGFIIHIYNLNVELDEISDNNNLENTTAELWTQNLTVV